MSYYRERSNLPSIFSALFQLFAMAREMKTSRSQATSEITFRVTELHMTQNTEDTQIVARLMMILSLQIKSIVSPEAWRDFHLLAHLPTQ